MNMHPALGIDYGDVRIGVAATDPMGILAHPVETVPATNRSTAILRITELAQQRRVNVIVLGLPLRMDGTEGSAAAKVRDFGTLLHQATPEIPLVYVDETLTTVSASEKLRESGKKAKNQRQIIDQAAAVEILNYWMEQSAL